MKRTSWGPFSGICFTEVSSLTGISLRAATLRVSLVLRVVEVDGEVAISKKRTGSRYLVGVATQPILCVGGNVSVFELNFFVVDQEPNPLCLHALLSRLIPLHTAMTINSFNGQAAGLVQFC